MKVCANERNASLLASYKASAAKVRRRQRLSERGLGVLSATNRESSTAPEKHTIGLSDKARSTEECCPKRQLVNKERDDCSFRVPGLWYFGRQST